MDKDKRPLICRLGFQLCRLGLHKPLGDYHHNFIGKLNGETGLKCPCGLMVESSLGWSGDKMLLSEAHT